MSAGTEHGFTLWELLVAIAVAGVLLGIGVPSFIEFQRNNAMAAAANELVTAVLMARAEAVKQQRPVTLCLSTNPTAPSPPCATGGIANSGAAGFVVWLDDTGNVDADASPVTTDATDGNAVFNAGETVLRRSAAPGGAITVSANAGFVTYMPNGFPRAPFAQRWILLCDERGNRSSGAFSTARAIRIDTTGRGQVFQEVADVTAALDAIVAASVAADCP